jgi:hypothetical protein
VTTGDPAIPVLIDKDGQLGTTSSSRKFKDDIKPMGQAREAILALKPVTFHYKDKDTEDAKREAQFRLIAEDVTEVNPDLIVRDKYGEIYSVRYEAVNVMLLKPRRCAPCPRALQGAATAKGRHVSSRGGFFVSCDGPARITRPAATSEIEINYRMTYSQPGPDRKAGPQRTTISDGS